MDQNGRENTPESTEEWESGSHVFILSSSGKPVYTRRGSEDRLATLSGVMQALVSFVQSNNDTIRSIRAGNTTIEFLVADPVTLVAVARDGQRGSELQCNLRHLHNLILFILTSAQLERIYKERKNFDLRRLLAGSERLIDHLLDYMPMEPGFFLTAVPCLSLESSARRSVANAISQVCSKLKEVVFAVVVMDGKVLCQLRMDQYSLKAPDLLLILNLVASTESFKSGETWTPLCLPQFDVSGYLHAHVSYLADDCPACLLILTVNKDIFYQLSEAKERLVEKLRRGGLLETINSAHRAPAHCTSSLGIPELRHFLCVIPQIGSYFCPKFEAPYDTTEAQTNLISAYRSVYESVTTQNLKLVFVRRPVETIFGWSKAQMQLFLVLEPMVSYDDAVRYVGKVLAWIERHEDSILMREDHVF